MKKTFDEAYDNAMIDCSVIVLSPTNRDRVSNFKRTGTEYESIKRQPNARHVTSWLRANQTLKRVVARVMNRFQLVQATLDFVFARARFVFS